MSGDSDSLQRVMQGMTVAEQASFLNDVQLLIVLYGGDQRRLDGHTVSEVRQKAAAGRKYVGERNVAFLGQLIRDMSRRSIQSVELHVDDAGIFSGPQVGYRPTSYSLDKLKAIFVKYGGVVDTAARAATVAARASRDSAPVAPAGDGCANPLSLAEAGRVWERIRSDRQAFVENCTKADGALVARPGGVPPQEAARNAASSCAAEAERVSACMARAGARANDCICSGGE
ncbi:hypothetical protein [Thauera sinica]|uniref:Uncharacterized protein n=1 Tax=Thauera sinica TaxID=2665146 RepID=A0ABW1AT91_9RHOO|nr:hypothetical protein [Thauera sp. K11]